MTKYINEETLRKLMYEEAFEKDSDMQKWDSGCWIRYKLFENCLEAVPAEDVMEIKHGRWHDVYMSSASSFVGTCSVCGTSNDIPPVPLAKYCPNCGAKMDEGEDE